MFKREQELSKFESFIYKWIIRFFSILILGEFYFMYRFQGLDWHRFLISIHELLKGALL